MAAPIQAAPIQAVPIVQLQGITKTFPGVVANQNIELDVRAGEIHALLGENGAGKSTLMNILTGIYQPDAGHILLDGSRRRFAAPADAIAAGIGMVHQHFKLVSSFTVAENLHLGWDRTPILLRDRDLAARTSSLADSLGLAVRPDARIGDLSTGERQRVEILRVLGRAARVLILDEPTAVLTPAEARELFKTLKRFVAGGNAVIFISHKLDEVLEISDRISVLRGGRKISTDVTRDCSASMLASRMVGHDMVLKRPALAARPERRVAAAGATGAAAAAAGAGAGATGEGAAAVAGAGAAASGAVAAVRRLRDIVVRDPLGRPLLDRVCIDLHAGEILGIAGVSGSGQRELSQVLTGVRRAHSGDISLEGADFSGRSAREFAEFGVGHIPEDRLQSGLAPALSVTDNSVMREYGRPPLSWGAWYWPRHALALARAIATAAAVVVPDFAMPAANLSGGNQQRLVARREMRIATKVLIAAYPSRGLDVGAVDALMRYLVELRDAGVGVVIISEELEELLRLADRIAVLCRGAVMGVVDPRTVSLEEIGLLMAGQRGAAATTPCGEGAASAASALEQRV